MLMGGAKFTGRAQKGTRIWALAPLLVALLPVGEQEYVFCLVVILPRKNKQWPLLHEACPRFFNQFAFNI